MATPTLMEVVDDDNVVDIINCVALFYEKGASGNAFLPKEIFRALVSRQLKTLKVVKETVRWVDLSFSKELKRGLSFNDLNILIHTVAWNTSGLCCLRYGRQRVATLDGGANFLLGRVSAFGRAIYSIQ